MCNNELREEVLKLYKVSKPSKNYQEDSHSGSMKNNEKRNNEKNEMKYGNSDSKYGNHENHKHKGDKNNKDSSGHSMHGGSSKNIYKGKVKSEFGGTEIIK